MPNVKQTDISDCGIACVKAILHHYNIEVELSELKLFNPLKIGFYSFMDLSLLLEKFNIEAIGYVSDFKSLSQLRSPFIAHVRIKKFFPHFVAIHVVDTSNAYCMNPSTGKITPLSEVDFLKIWSGKILVPSTPAIGKKFPSRNNTSLVVSFILNKRTTLSLILIVAGFYLIIKTFI